MSAHCVGPIVQAGEGRVKFARVVKFNVETVVLVETVDQVTFEVTLRVPEARGIPSTVV